MKLSLEQKKRVSEILGNISVAWFAAGVISPIFISRTSIFETILSFLAGLLATLVFALTSVYTIRRSKHE